MKVSSSANVGSVPKCQSRSWIVVIAKLYIAIVDIVDKQSSRLRMSPFDCRLLQTQHQLVALLQVHQKATWASFPSPLSNIVCLPTLFFFVHHCSRSDRSSCPCSPCPPLPTRHSFDDPSFPGWIGCAGDPFPGRSYFFAFAILFVFTGSVAMVTRRKGARSKKKRIVSLSRC